MAIFLAYALLSNSIKKEAQKQFAFIWDGEQHKLSLVQSLLILLLSVDWPQFPSKTELGGTEREIFFIKDWLMCFRRPRSSIICRWQAGNPGKPRVWFCPRPKAWEPEVIIQIPVWEQEIMRWDVRAQAVRQEKRGKNSFFPHLWFYSGPQQLYDAHPQWSRNLLGWVHKFK